MVNLPFVSVIILNFNGKQFLGECLSSLNNINYPADRYEVTIGDNASTDDSIEFLKNNFSWVKIIRFDKNYGFCKSNNMCAQEAKGEYLVFLNNDTFVDKDWLINLAGGVQKNKEIISCACKMFFPDLANGKLINTAGGVILPNGCGIYNGWLEMDSEKYNREEYTAFGCGAGVLVEKKFFLETGGFDEYFFYSGEEMDLGFRIWTNGYKVLYTPKAIMYHYMGATGFIKRKRSPEIEFLVVRNKLYFILKNFEIQNIVKGLLLSLFAASMEIFYCLLHRNFQIPLSVMRAYLTIIKDSNLILKKRRITQATRKLTDKDLYKMGIIVGVKEWLRRSRSVKDNSETHFGSIYDTKNAVKIKVDENGNFTFHKS